MVLWFMQRYVVTFYVFLTPRVHQVIAELRELKADISELGRSLDGSSIGFILRQGGVAKSKTTGACMYSAGS